jgi:hypothetical protein
MNIENALKEIGVAYPESNGIYTMTQQEIGEMFVKFHNMLPNSMFQYAPRRHGKLTNLSI